METPPLILIIEDDYTLSKMYAEKFRIEGFRVLVARDGEVGLTFAAQYKPHFILLDMMLPKRSGKSFLSQLKSLPEISQIPIVALTNLAEKGEADSAREMGVKEYLVKAMHTPEEVVSTVKKYLLV